MGVDIKAAEQVRRKIGKRTNDQSLGTEAIGALILKFTLPSAIATMVTTIFSMMDQVFIARGIGYIGNGITAAVGPLMLISGAFCSLFTIGSAAFFSLKLGAGKNEEAQKGVGNAFTVLISFSILFFILTNVFLEALLPLFGTTANMMSEALIYTRIILLGLPLSSISGVVVNLIRADGSPKYAMTTTIVESCVSVALDYVFIFHFHMGMKGIALGTVLGQIVSFVMIMAYTRNFKNVHLTKESFIPSWKVIRKMASFGLGNFSNMASIILVNTATNNMLTQFGAASKYGAEIPLAAMGMTSQVNMFMIGFVLAVSMGAQPILGFNYGAKKYARVKKTYYYTMLLAAGATTLGTLLIMFFPGAITTIVGESDPLYNEFFVKSMQIYLMLCIFNGLQTVTSNFFQSIGKPIQSVTIYLIRQLVFFVPLILLLPRAMGVEGVLWSGPITDGSVFILSMVLIVIQMRKMNKDIAATA